MGSKMIRSFMIGAIVMLVLGGLFWLIPESVPRDEAPPQGEGTEIAVLPSDGGTDQQVETDAPSTPAVEDTSEPTGDRTDPEQVARAFMNTYPGDVHSLADPTFLASLDGVDATLLEQVTDMSLEQVDQATDEVYERYAYTVSGTYRGEEVQIYSIVVARPAEPGEGGSAAENDLAFQVHSFDWALAMLGDEGRPGPAAGVLSPLSAEQRGHLISQTRTEVIVPILTVDPEESTEQRQERLDELTVESIDVTPPMSRSGRYAMTTEILSQAYSTELGGPITITYTGTWVDPYDPAYHGSWSLTATIARDDNGGLIVHGVVGTPPAESNGNDG
ncbi:hypothetical protein [Brachybacterium vulturis]|uniref:hypothetical protein n=1 Tax=Brachybacterium vulturis TaxID=2017484 RepID=UPI0037362884